MKKILQKVLIVMIFLTGLSLLLYPFVSNVWNTYRQSKLITTYDQIVNEQPEEKDYSAEWERARNYNVALMDKKLPDFIAESSDHETPDSEYMACLNLYGDGMMGYVEIPKIDTKLPVYHTTGDEVLQKAAGHLEGSSLPVGGEGTHAVICAHRGLPNAALFIDLDKLTVGDHFLIYILDEILCYEVDQILVVEPHETECLAAEEGLEYVTLMTCTPYGVNSHRLMIRGHRVPYEPEVEAVMQEETAGAVQNSAHTDYLLWMITGLVIMALFLIVLLVVDKVFYKHRSVSGKETGEVRCKDKELE